MTEYRIDDLARLAGIASRNIREYQEKGLLDYPRREGRVAWYTEEHLTRARLVAQLVARGHSLSGVRQLLDTWERGGNLEDLIPAEQIMTKPWTDERARRMTLRDLRRGFGKWITPNDTRRAIALGMIEREGAGFRVPSPRIIEAGEQLVALGVPMATVLDIAEGMARDVAVIADRFVDPVREQLIPDGVLPRPEDILEVTRTIDRLRPLAFSATEAFLAQAMQRALSAAFDVALGGTYQQERSRLPKAAAPEPKRRRRRSSTAE